MICSGFLCRFLQKEIIQNMFERIIHTLAFVFQKYFLTSLKTRIRVEYATSCQKMRLITKLLINIRLLLEYG
jgi:hypothetical protein